MGDTVQVTQTAVWKKVIIFSVVTLSVFAFAASARSTQAATQTFVSGKTVIQDTTTPVAAAQITCRVDTLGLSVAVTSDSSGNYSCATDTASFTTGTQIQVEPRAPTGYNTVGSLFLTWAGSALTDQNVEFIQATKTIHATAVDQDGVEVFAQFTAQPINPAPGQASQVQVDDEAAEMQVTGGEWVVIADANLSEQDATRYPWVAIGGGQRVSFADDSTEEEVTLEFKVVRTNIRASLTILNADGDTLNEGFVADVIFEGFNSDYGAMVTRRKVSSSTGVSSIYLLPGVWKVTVYDNVQLEGQSFDPEDMKFVITGQTSAEIAQAAEDKGGDAGGNQGGNQGGEIIDGGETTVTVDLGTVQAQESAGSISGSLSVLNSDVSPVTQNIEVTVTNTDIDFRMAGSTQGSGNSFAFNNLPLGHYTVTVSDDGFFPMQTASAVITAEELSTSDLEISANYTDARVTGTLVDNNGDALTNFPGSVVVKGGDFEFSAPVQTDGTYDLKMFTAGLPDDNMELEVVPQPGATAFNPNPVTVPVVENSTFQTQISMSSDEATISGNIIDLGGDQLTNAEFGDEPKVMALNVETGAVETTVVNDDGTWEMQVGPGSWTPVLQIANPVDASVMAPPKNNDVIAVEAGDTETVDLPVMPTVGTVSGTVTDPDGAVIPQAPILLTNLPALQAEAAAAGETVDESKIISVAVTSDADGNFTKALPEGDFTAVFGSNPDIAEFTEPTTKTFSITEDGAETVDAEYRESPATVSGDIGSGFENATVTATNPNGGTETVDVAPDGRYSMAVAPADGWSFTVSGVKDGELYIAQEASVNIDSGDNTLNPSLEGTGMNFPAAVTVTTAADESIVLSNTDGAKVSIPAYTAGFSGDVVATLQPVVSFAQNADLSQVGISYDVQVTLDGIPVKQLNGDATVTLPLDEALVGTVEPESIQAAYYNPDLKSFLVDGVVADTNGTQMVIQTKHFSRFAATTAVSTSSNATPGLPTGLTAKKIKKHSAVIDWTAPEGSTVTKYVLQVRVKGISKKSKWQKYNKVQKTQRKVTGLKQGKTYQYRLKACNGDLCSAFTSWKKFKTKS